MRRSVSATFAILVTLAVVPSSLAAGPAPDPAPVVVAADLDGVPISGAEIPLHFCHDLDFPKIHCFSTAEGMEMAVADAAGASASSSATSQSAEVGSMELNGPLEPIGGSANYVQIYSGLMTTGAIMTLSQDYDTLAVISWNDRIRSYRSLNAGRGIFWTDWYATGSSMAFCCDVLANAMPAAFDRTITSVYRQ